MYWVYTILVTDPLKIYSEFQVFQWDEGNETKNWKSHGVNQAEAEEIFDNMPIIVAEDSSHSISEIRYVAYGKTDNNRHLTAVFTIRGKSIRIISARDQSRKERMFYDQA